MEQKTEKMLLHTENIVIITEIDIFHSLLLIVILSHFFSLYVVITAVAAPVCFFCVCVCVCFLPYFCSLCCLFVWLSVCVLHHCIVCIYINLAFVCMPGVYMSTHLKTELKKV